MQAHLHFCEAKNIFKSMCNSVNDYKTCSCCEHIYVKTMHFEIVCFINMSLQDSNIKKKCFKWIFNKIH